MAFKDRLRELRVAKGLTQMQLAAAAGITLSAVTQMEIGKVTNPRLGTLKALAGVLGCTLDELAEGSGEPPPARKKRRGKP
jgi:transcriptional regulator with XRE-family HTH domain